MQNPATNLGRALHTAIGACITALLLVPCAAAGPLELTNPEPRWVAVAFEISPADRPAQRRARFTPRLPARLEPGEHPGQVRIRVAGALIERFLLPEQDPVPGSFGAFTWTFDARTGHVEAAELEGAVRKQVGWGIAAWTTLARIRVQMSTHEPVTFQTTALMGETIHHLCEGPQLAGCTRVEPSPLDPLTGYVNAVGSVRADSGPLRAESFSPLGEAIFSEVDAEAAKFWTHGLDAALHADVAAPPPALGAIER